MFKIAKDEKRRVKAVIEGLEGDGKTALSLLFPGPLWVIDTERGTNILKDKFFMVLSMNHMGGMAAALNEVKKNEADIETLVIDSASPLWHDLVYQYSQKKLQKRGTDDLSFNDWGPIKRQWTAFLNRLIDLDMNIVLTARLKDQYGKSNGGKMPEVVGMTADLEKSTVHLFDFVLRAHRQPNAKTKRDDFFITVNKSRRDELPTGKRFNVTAKNGFDELFSPLINSLSTGVDPIPSETPLLEEEPASEVAPLTTEEKLSAINEKFMGESDLPSDSEIKVVMTQASKIIWLAENIDDQKKFSKAHGKALLMGIFGVDSTKKLTRLQFDQFSHSINFLYEVGERRVVDLKGYATPRYQELYKMVFPPQPQATPAKEIANG